MRVGAASTAGWARLALAALAATYGLLAVGVASRHGDLTTVAGHSAVVAAAQLAAGWALVAAGLVTWARRPAWPAGPLAVAAGIAWFAPDWVGWQTGPGTARILATGALGITAAVVAHVGLGAPGGSPERGLAWRLAVTIWAATAVVGIGRALFYDPLADPDCTAYCAPNPLLVQGDAAAAGVLDRVEVAVALLAPVAIASVAGRRLRRADAATRATAGPMIVAGAVFLCASAAGVLAQRAGPSGDAARPLLVTVVATQAVALLALAASLAWATERARRGARAIRRLASDVTADAPGASLEATLARATGDRTLRVAYPLGGGGAWVDGEGEPVPKPVREPGRSLTEILREGRTIAAVTHAPAALDSPVLEREIGTAARLAVDNERLRAGTRAQLRELRSSRARIVATGDAERRHLERDLHDGAQQRLVGLSLALGLARAELDLERAPQAARRLDEAGASLRAALGDLRELAHGIHPVQLSEEGLAAALETLTVRARVPVALGAVAEVRLPAPVEIAAYALVDDAVARAERRAVAATIGVQARLVDGRLTVDVADPGEADAALAGRDLVAVADRIGALDGTLEIDRAAAGSGVRIRAQLPCA